MSRFKALLILIGLLVFCGAIIYGLCQAGIFEVLGEAISIPTP